MPTTATETCNRCGDRLVLSDRPARTRNCPACGGIAGLTDAEPSGPITVRVVPLRLRSAFRQFCSRRGYAVNRAIVTLMARAILADADLGDAAGGRQYDPADRRLRDDDGNPQ